MAKGDAADQHVEQGAAEGPDVARAGGAGAVAELRGGLKWGGMG